MNGPKVDLSQMMRKLEEVAFLFRAQGMMGRLVTGDERAVVDELATMRPEQVKRVLDAASRLSVLAGHRNELMSKQ